VVRIRLVRVDSWLGLVLVRVDSWIGFALVTEATSTKKGRIHEMTRTKQHDPRNDRIASGVAGATMKAQALWKQ
jgi:hypothetical protein